ncbi:MAG: AEC family transporter [Candidatus Gallimonas sp.]
MVQIIVKVLIIMLVLIAFAIPGFLLRKANLVRPESMLSLVNILLYLCQPMLTIKAFAVDPLPCSGAVLLNFLYVLLLSLAAILLTFGAAKLVFSFMKKPEERKARDVLVFIGTFSNCAFVGIPFVDMFTDGNREAMMYVIVFTAAFNLLLWTLGAYLITQDRSQISLKKAFLNPCTIGTAAGLLLFCVPQINIFNMPAVSELQQIVVYTGNMTAPLSMMIVGIRLAEISPRKLFCDGRIYLASAVRLALSFGLTYLMILPFRLTGLFAENPYVLLAPVIAMAMPPAASVVAFAEKFDGEKDLAAAAYTTGTLLSVATLPFALLLISL